MPDQSFDQWFDGNPISYHKDEPRATGGPVNPDYHPASEPDHKEIIVNTDNPWLFPNETPAGFLVVNGINPDEFNRAVAERPEMLRDMIRLKKNVIPPEVLAELGLTEYNPGEALAALERGKNLSVRHVGDEHFGQRLRAALERLPDDMKNDPAYADPVGWVNRARGGIDLAQPGKDTTAYTIHTMTPAGEIDRIIHLNRQQFEALSSSEDWGVSIGFQVDKPPRKAGLLERFFQNVRALVRYIIRGRNHG